MNKVNKIVEEHKKRQSEIERLEKTEQDILNKMNNTRQIKQMEMNKLDDMKMS